MSDFIKQKLTSRKFWVGMALAFVGIVSLVCGAVWENDALFNAGQQLLIAGGGAYMGIECIVDVARLIADAAKSKETTSVVKSITANAQSNEVVAKALDTAKANADVIADAETEVAKEATEEASSETE